MNKLVVQACWFVSIIVSIPVMAQGQADPATAEPATKELAVEKKSPQAISTDTNRVREANINLRTTVTGNQEQPRVMYILPWQSPASPDLEMEMLSSQQDAVFGHVERDELQRSLEATGELDEPLTD
jgi:hypothetical protein